MAAFAISLFAAWAMGCESIAILFIGVLISPFMLVVVWSLSASVLVPFVIPASPTFTTLDLGGK